MEKKSKKSGFKNWRLDTVANRILVVALAIVMTIQFCTPTFSGVSFAEDTLEEPAIGETVDAQDEVPGEETGQDANLQEEAPPAPEAEVTAPQDEVEEEPQQEEASVTEETAADDQTADVSDEQTEVSGDAPVVTDDQTSDETAVDEPAEDSQEVVDENEQKEETEAEDPWDAKTFDGSANRVKVHVEAPQGAFPEGTTMVVTKVYKADVIDAVESAVEGDVEHVRAVDITFFDKDGKEIQPQKKINVQLTSTAFSENADLSVVHIDDEGDANLVKNAEFDGTTAEFNTKQFSIYAIVETGTNARILVKFMNGTEKIDDMYVKENDDMEVVLYDPGVGTLTDGVYFRGWTTDPDYTPSTPAKTIEDVRDEVAAMLPPDADGKEVVYYAMLFKDYRITYLDEYGISLGQEEVTFRADSPSAEKTYKVNMAYTVQNENYHFEGWNVKEGSSNIVGYEDKAYQNNDIITITGDIIFSVNAPEGHWFIFNENGKGATYNAPQFVYSDDTPTRPADANMIRNGYRFGGWFATKEEADGTSNTQYDFDQKLTDKTTVYARWIANTTAPYTIIIWKQNIDGDGYDFVESISRTGNVGSAINTVRQQGSGNNAYAQVQRTGNTWSNVQYTGFHLDRFDQNVTIKTEGNTVLNVYYNRNEYTLTFQAQEYTYTQSNSNQDGYYYIPLAGGGYEQVYLDHHNGNGGYWTIYYSDQYSNGSVYSGLKYTRSNNATWTNVKTITALYGQPIGDNFPIVGTNGVTYDNGERWSPQSSSTYNQVLIYIDTMPNESVTFRLNTADHSTKTITYYVEALPGETPAITYNGKGFVIYKSVDANYGFFTEAEDYINLVGFSKGGTAYPPRAYNGNGTQLNSVWNNSNARNVQCFYTRNVYPINFMDGKYVNGDNNPLEENGMGQIATQTGIAYGADISAQNNYKPDAAHTPSGFVFEGWYIDSACTQPYEFTTMPEGGVTVYAKWRQKQYRVFLHVNYPERRNRKYQLGY